MTTNPRDWTPGVSEYRAMDITLTRENIAEAIRYWATARGLIKAGDAVDAYCTLSLQGDHVRANFAWKESAT